MGLKNKVLYLTFDDGPHPEITSKVMEMLRRYEAKATFFCIGDNVVRFPETYETIRQQGHSVGNHTFHHLNGWKTEDSVYLDNIRQASKVIDSRLFRPPYGRIKISQRKKLMQESPNMKVVMWTVLSGDFDQNISPEKCSKNVIRNARPGSIIVFHDSDKAKERMLFALPRVLEYFTKRGYRFESI